MLLSVPQRVIHPLRRRPMVHGGGVKAFVLIPKGKIALGKLAQAMMHNATILQMEGNF